MNFSYEHLNDILTYAIKQGYIFQTALEYYNEPTISKTVVLRIDVDLSVKKLIHILDIMNSLQIKSSIFVRLHAPEYNPFDFENYRILKQAIIQGHELGLHSEIIDQAKIWNENPDSCLRRDIDVFENIFDYKISGVASHGGATEFNNLDFWHQNSPTCFGLIYEAYTSSCGKNLFKDGVYVSDSEITRWKAYKEGNLYENVFENPTYFLQQDLPFINILIHPDTFYFRHPYE